MHIFVALSHINIYRVYDDGNVVVVVGPTTSVVVVMGGIVVVVGSTIIVVVGEGIEVVVGPTPKNSSASASFGMYAELVDKTNAPNTGGTGVVSRLEIIML